MTWKNNVGYCLLLPVFLYCEFLYAGIAIVVHKDAPFTSIAVEEVANIFLGKTNELPNGDVLRAVDFHDSEEMKATFYKLVTNKSLVQVKAYWSRLLFTGRGQPPKKYLYEEEIVNIIRSKPGYIGYISTDSVVADVKVVLSID